MTHRLLACALFCLTSCGGSSSGTVDSPAGGSADAPVIDAPPIDAPPTAAQACTTAAAQRCTKLATCSPADLSKRFGDLATCENRIALTCTEALAASDTGNTPDTTLACAAAVEAESCTDFFTKAPPMACTTQVGPGSGACSFSAQCTTGFCSLGAADLCATCAPQPRVGDSCVTVGCGQDLVCVAATSTCQAPVAAAGACNKDLPCADGFTCVGAIAAGSGSGSGSGTDGQCLAEVTTANTACDPKHKTGPDCSADAGLTCNTTSLVCVAQPLVGAGVACGLLDGVRTACTAAATCVIGAGSGSGSGTTGTCVAPAADGGDCDTVAGPDCLTPAKCVPTTPGGTAGTCQLPGSMTCP